VIAREARTGLGGPAVEAVELSRRFGKFLAVDRVSFEVERGEIFGYLGANGAGKSTTIRMLTGLLTPTSGKGRVAGFDVGTEAEAVKASIGYMSQKFSLYLDLPVRENLLFFGGAYGLSGKALARRADEVLELADLRDAGGVTTGDLPGGVRQRLALACAILQRPQVVFLDEPTAGVDPVARRTFWRIIRDLAREGTTVFVTTHYLDEAEYCRRIGLMVDGRLVALDTPAALKAGVGADRVRIQTVDDEAAIIALAEHFDLEAHISERSVTFYVPSGEEFVPRLFAELAVPITSVSVSRPTLDDVFMSYTGTTIRDAEESSAGQRNRIVMQAMTGARR
jgi:ABC-2 type transport system ATP-binding protein